MSATMPPSRSDHGNAGGRKPTNANKHGEKEKRKRKRGERIRRKSCRKCRISHLECIPRPRTNPMALLCERCHDAAAQEGRTISVCPGYESEADRSVAPHPVPSSSAEPSARRNSSSQVQLSHPSTDHSAIAGSSSPLDQLAIDQNSVPLTPVPSQGVSPVSNPYHGWPGGFRVPGGGGSVQLSGPTTSNASAGPAFPQFHPHIQPIPPYMANTQHHYHGYHGSIPQPRHHGPAQNTSYIPNNTVSHSPHPGFSDDPGTRHQYNIPQTFGHGLNAENSQWGLQPSMGDHDHTHTHAQATPRRSSAPHLTVEIPDTSGSELSSGIDGTHSAPPEASNIPYSYTGHSQSLSPWQPTFPQYPTANVAQYEPTALLPQQWYENANVAGAGSISGPGLTENGAHESDADAHYGHPH